MKKARSFPKEDVDIETLWDGEAEAYHINLKDTKGNTKQIVIPEASFKDRSKMLKFLHNFAKLTYRTVG